MYELNLIAVFQLLCLFLGCLFLKRVFNAATQIKKSAALPGLPPNVQLSEAQWALNCLLYECDLVVGNSCYKRLLVFWNCHTESGHVPNIKWEFSCIFEHDLPQEIIRELRADMEEFRAMQAEDNDNGGRLIYQQLRRTIVQQFGSKTAFNNAHPRLGRSIAQLNRHLRTESYLTEGQQYFLYTVLKYLTAETVEAIELYKIKATYLSEAALQEEITCPPIELPKERPVWAIWEMIERSRSGGGRSWLGWIREQWRRIWRRGE